MIDVGSNYLYVVFLQAFTPQSAASAIEACQMLADKHALADIREHLHFVDDKALLDTVLDHLWACESR